MKKSLLIAALTATIALTGCAGDRAGAVSNQIAFQADSFNVSRKVTVYDTRHTEPVYEVQGLVSVVVSNNRLDIIIKEGDRYKKHIVGLNENTMFVVEDLEGIEVRE